MNIICSNKILNLPNLRLKGFVDEWEEKKLETICKIKTGNCDLVDKEKDGKYPLFVRSDKIERINNYAFDCEAILIPGDGRIGEILHYINGKFNFHQRVYCIYECNQNLKYIHFEFQKNLKKI